jgi:hypothetical protein
MDRYSANLKGDLKDFYEQSITDSENYLLQASEIALIEAQIKSLLDIGIQCGSVWKRLEQETAKLKHYAKQGKTDMVQSQLAVILRIIDEGIQFSSNRMECNTLIKQKSKLIAEECKRLTLAGEYINREQARIFVTGLLESIRRHIDDTTILREIAADFTKSMATLKMSENQL